MEVNDELEIDIENKYMNKVVFTLEESIYILKRKDFCDEVEDMALDRLIKYIKEESIPKAVLKKEIEEIKGRKMDIVTSPIHGTNEKLEILEKDQIRKDILQEILKESK